MTPRHSGVADIQKVKGQGESPCQHGLSSMSPVISLESVEMWRCTDRHRE